MRTAVDLDLWGHRVRVSAGVPEVASLLRATLADHVLPDAVPLGFALKTPESPNGLHSLLDRSGLVLARARSWEECVAVLAEHLASFAPPPAGTFRTTLRAVIRTEGSQRSAALAAFPLLCIPPLVERQLDRRGQCVVDRLVVDMTSEAQLSLSPSPWPELRVGEPAGHCGGSATGAAVKAVLLPTSPGMSLKRHQLVALIASTLTGLGPEDALDAAGRLQDFAQAIPMNDVAARRRALEH